MLRITLKSLFAHKLRFVMSGAAIVLGVAFVAGSFIFTDTISKTFTSLFEQTSADVVVTRKPAFEGNAFEGPPVAQTLPATLVEQVQAVNGVAEARGQVQVDGVRLVGSNGKVVGTPGAPGFGIDWGEEPSSPLHLTAGRGPSRAGEVAIDSVAAEKGELEVGDDVTLLMPSGPNITAEVVGVFRFGTTGNLAGATLTAFDDATAQRLLTGPGLVTEIAVDAADGTGLDQLRDRVDAALAADYQVQTSTEVADETTAAIKEGLGFFNTILLAFAGVALFVGSFIILNTFSMIVAQRMRELALLRAVGASRGQVTRSVLVESLVMGLLGSLLGLAAGLGVAALLQFAFRSVGVEIPTDSLVFAPRTVVVSLVVGVAVTVFAAWFPARRAAKVPPVAAMRDDVAMAPGSLHRRAAAGSVLAAAGVAGLVGALLVDSGSRSAQLVGLGVLLTLLGVIALSPVVGRPVVATLGVPVRRLRGTVGVLATENAKRNPRRTAATASALMIGLALVSGFGVLAASTNASVTRLIDRTIGADYVVSDAIGTPFSPEITAQVRATPGVADVVVQRGGPAEVDGSGVFLSAVSPSGLDQAVAVDLTAGEVGSLADGALLVDSRAAEANGWSVGDRVAVALPGARDTLPVGGIYAANQALNQYVVSIGTWERLGGPNRDQFLYVVAADRAEPAALQPALERTLEPYPNVDLKDQTEFKEQQRGQINQLLSLIYALLALAIIVAVLGIVNTLALSVMERTREIGLLRAVGMSRSQLRSMVRWESVVIAVFGAVLGLGLGIVFGVVLQRALVEQGVETLALPWGSLTVFLVLAALIGVLAAVWPARRAARMDVLRAITTE